MTPARKDPGSMTSADTDASSRMKDLLQVFPHVCQVSLAGLVVTVIL